MLCLCSAVHHRRGAVSPGGGHRTPRSALPPSPSTSVHRLMDSKSAIPSLRVFHPTWVGGGAPKGAGAQASYAVFQPRQLKNGNFRN